MGKILSIVEMANELIAFYLYMILQFFMLQSLNQAEGEKWLQIVLML